MSGGGRDLTSLFARMRHGDAEAVNGVMSPLHAELYRLATLVTRLSTLDHRASRVVVRRFFCEHAHQEVCESLGEKLPTARRGSVFARCWLKTRLPRPRA